jgi:hypothetical protein
MNCNFYHTFWILQNLRLNVARFISVCCKRPSDGISPIRRLDASSPVLFFLPSAPPPSSQVSWLFPFVAPSRSRLQFRLRRHLPAAAAAPSCSDAEPLHPLSPPLVQGHGVSSPRAAARAPSRGRRHALPRVSSPASSQQGGGGGGGRAPPRGRPRFGSSQHGFVNLSAQMKFTRYEWSFDASD